MNPVKVIDFGGNEPDARLRERLKSAVSGQSVPAGLAEKVRQQIRQAGRQPIASSGWTRWAPSPRP